MELCIFGSGGHAKVIADTALELNLYERVYLYSKTNQINLSSLPKSCFFVNDDPSFTQQDNVQSILAIGDSIIRSSIVKNYPEHNFCTLIHKRSVVSERARIEEGAFIGPGAIINIDSCIHDHSIINSHAIVEHDCEVGKFSQLGPGAIICGNVSLGSHVFLGSNSCVNPGISICDNVIIGSGAVVTEDILEEGTYVGLPATKIT